MPVRINWPVLISVIFLVNLLALANSAPEHPRSSDTKRRPTKKPQNEPSLPISKEDSPTQSAHKSQRASKTTVEPKIYLNNETKLVYIDETSESGHLIGEIFSSDGERGKTPKHERTSKIVEKSTSGDESRERRIFESNAPTNYSIFLVSRHKEHIAILLDIEQVDFEPIINCEYQELRFSIVGEISKKLLSEKSSNDEGEEIQQQQQSDEDAASISDDDSSAAEALPAEVYSPPLPASEAMSLLLNAPLNKTILGTDQTYDFRIIDSTIDYLHDETCKELQANATSTSDADPDIRPSRRTIGGADRHRRTARKSSQHRKSKANKSYREDRCPVESGLFKDIMSAKLSEYFEWDDFKIICGKTKQLVIPMRSLKLSVYSDEFAPDSRFVIKYKFISDPSLLPATDNGIYYCRNRNTIDLSLKCNGIDDCGDASDESIKICGYPTGVRSLLGDHASPSRRKTTPHQSSSSHPTNNGSHSAHNCNHHLYTDGKKKRLIHYNEDVLHCCQSSEWLSVVPQNQANQVSNFQSIIEGPMSLFSGPLFAPTGKSGTDRSRNRRVKRIVGGGVALRGAWPGQVSLQYELVEPLCHFCAGTLIHPQYVLTAGHCITKEGLNRGIKVVLGAHDLRQFGDYVQVRYVDDAQIYPGVNVKHLSFEWDNDMNNDIALLRLNAPILITPYVAPACLPPYNTPLAVNTTCRSIGWGQTHGSGSSNLLKHLPLKVANSSTCSKQLLDRDDDEQQSPSGKKKTSQISRQTRRKSRRDFAHERWSIPTSESEYADVDEYSNQTMVCVNNDQGHGICQGDSGGPLYCDRITSTGEKCTEIYGVASFIIQYATVGAMCAVKNLPGIFGEVSSKTEWISSTIKMFEQTYRLKYS